MDRICTFHQHARNERRRNGLQLPLHGQQLIGLFTLTLSAIFNLLILSQLQVYALRIVSIVFYSLFYTAHFIAHFLVVLLDPAEKEVRKSKEYQVPEFDRRIHAHVIENGRCHLCNIQISGNQTKHCGLCNKCVDRFDHHCKWLNQCIGARNYKAFIVCVITATIISLYTIVLCIISIITFFSFSQFLSPLARMMSQCTSDTDENICAKSIVYLIYLCVTAVVAIVISGVLLHLFIFHLFINLIGMTTYDYMTKPSEEVVRSIKACKRKFYQLFYCCGLSRRNAENGDARNANGIAKTNPTNTHGVIALLNSVVNNFGRFKRFVSHDDNRVHPEVNDNGTNNENDKDSKV